ncbi:hypothetical protein V3G39_10020 [Dermatophilaceae bacterium Sec6.4]
MSTLSAPEVNDLTGLSIRELLQDLTRLQNTVSADAAASGYRPSPGGVARRAALRQREETITQELHRRRQHEPPAMNR